MSHLNGTATKSAAQMRMMMSSDRPMPNWVNETHDRVGPKPPALPSNNNTVQSKQLPPPPVPRKNQAEPDYEIIEFTNQQYSNASPLRPKTPDAKRSDGLKCQLCGSSNPWVRCDQCGNQIFCASCDDMFHRHPKRQTHVRKAMEKSQSIKPPLPPKTDLQFSAPVPPPRRNKKAFPSPLPVRRDQSAQLPPQVAAQMQQNGTLKRTPINIANRPLPDTPNQGPSSRSSTPNSKSVFDAIQRPPSVTLEKIKNKASATLNKMALLQQRYRQHQELKGDGSKMNSTTHLNSDQMSDWSIPSSPTRLRSGSMSSGMNSTANYRPSMDGGFPGMHNQMQGGHMNPASTMRPIMRGSASVFNLNQVGNQRQMPMNQGQWNGMGQGSSMAQINCPGCNNQGWNHSCGRDGWMNGSSHNLHGSNMSLNMPAGYYPPQQHPMGAPPPVWFNNAGWAGPPNMYPYPYPMMNGMMTLPRPPRSRMGSRAGSPALSIKSRKSMMSSRHKRASYVEHELTDDEDSEDDRRSIRSHRSELPGQRRRNPRKNSLTSHSFDDEIDEFSRSRSKPRSTAAAIPRDRTLTNQKPVAASTVPANRRPAAHLIRDRTERGSISSKSKAYSDSPLTPDSENEPPTKALVQAKIQEKLSKQKETPPSPPKQPAVVKKMAPIYKPTESEEESEQEEQEEEEEESEEDNDTKATEEVMSLGPPPSTPDHDWECEFCTFVNEANVKICAVCCKTPIQSPTKPVTPPAEKTITKSAPTKSTTATQSTRTVTKSTASTATSTAAKKVEKPAKVSTSVSTSSASTAAASTKIVNRKDTASSSSQQLPKQMSSIRLMSQSEDDSEAANGIKKKDANVVNKTQMSLDDIWATLEEDIKNAAAATKRNNERKISAGNQIDSDGDDVSTPYQSRSGREQAPKMKTSTGCGPSPPREVQTRSEKHNASVSTGTSPPPQSISTQTYDVLPAAGKAHQNLVEQQTNDDSYYKSGRSYSIAAPMQHVRDCSNSPSLAYNENQVQSLPPTPPLRNMSPIGIRKYNNEINLTDGDMLMGGGYLDRNNQYQYYGDMPMNAKTDHYRSQSDLRRDEPYLSRRPSIGDMLGYQKSHMNEPISSQWDPYEMRRRDAKPRDAGIELVMLLKEAEHYKFTAEELQAALKHCGDTHPIVWLRDNWSKLIKTVQTLATKYGQEQKENIIGTLSSIEAREALRVHKGNVWHAVTECIEQRQRKYREIASRSNYSREDVVTALTAHHGNLELALIDLGKTQIKPFLMRIWGSPNGIENDSGNLSLDFGDKPSKLDIDPSIHDFLNANAESLQLLKAKELLQQSQSHSSSTIHQQLQQQLHQQQNQQSHHSSLSKHPSRRDLIGSLSNLSINSYGNRTDYSEGGFESPTGDSSLGLSAAAGHNPHLLKDIETLIANMEQNQAKQNESMLKNIESMLGGLLEYQSQQQQQQQHKEQDKLLQSDATALQIPVQEQILDTNELLNEFEFTGEDVVFRKSPLPPNSKRSKSQSVDESHSVELNVKNFVSQHIQDIIPDLVEHVERELEDSTATDGFSEQFTEYNSMAAELEQLQAAVELPVDVPLPSTPPLVEQAPVTSVSMQEVLAPEPMQPIDIKDFVSKHIKDIVPDLVEQVRKELQQEAEMEKAAAERALQMQKLLYATSPEPTQSQSQAEDNNAAAAETVSLNLQAGTSISSVEPQINRQINDVIAFVDPPSVLNSGSDKAVVINEPSMAVPVNNKDQAQTVNIPIHHQPQTSLVEATESTDSTDEELPDAMVASVIENIPIPHVVLQTEVPATNSVDSQNASQQMESVIEILSNQNILTQPTLSVEPTKEVAVTTPATTSVAAVKSSTSQHERAANIQIALVDNNQATSEPTPNIPSSLNMEKTSLPEPITISSPQTEQLSLQPDITSDSPAIISPQNTEVNLNENNQSNIREARIPESVAVASSGAAAPTTDTPTPKSFRNVSETPREIIVDNGNVAEMIENYSNNLQSQEQPQTTPFASVAATQNTPHMINDPTISAMTIISTENQIAIATEGANGISLSIEPSTEKVEATLPQAAVPQTQQEQMSQSNVLSLASNETNSIGQIDNAFEVEPIIVSPVMDPTTAPISSQIDIEPSNAQSTMPTNIVDIPAAAEQSTYVNASVELGASNEQTQENLALQEELILIPETISEQAEENNNISVLANAEETAVLTAPSFETVTPHIPTVVNDTISDTQETVASDEQIIPTQASTPQPIQNQDISNNSQNMKTESTPTLPQASTSRTQSNPPRQNIQNKSGKRKRKNKRNKNKNFNYSAVQPAAPATVLPAANHQRRMTIDDLTLIDNEVSDSRNTSVDLTNNNFIITDSTISSGSLLTPSASQTENHNSTEALNTNSYEIDQNAADHKVDRVADHIVDLAVGDAADHVADHIDSHEADLVENHEADQVANRIAEHEIEHILDHVADHVADHIGDHVNDHAVDQIVGYVEDHIMDHVADHVADHTTDHVTDHVANHVADHVADHLVEILPLTDTSLPLNTLASIEQSISNVNDKIEFQPSESSVPNSDKTEIVADIENPNVDLQLISSRTTVETKVENHEPNSMQEANEATNESARNLDSNLKPERSHETVSIQTHQSPPEKDSNIGSSIEQSTDPTGTPQPSINEEEHNIEQSQLEEAEIGEVVPVDSNANEENETLLEKDTVVSTDNAIIVEETPQPDENSQDQTSTTQPTAPDAKIPQIVVDRPESEDIFQDLDEAAEEEHFFDQLDKDDDVQTMSHADADAENETSDDELFSIQSDENEQPNNPNLLQNSMSVASFGSTDGFISPTISNSEVILILNSDTGNNRESAIISLDRDSADLIGSMNKTEMHLQSETEVESSADLYRRLENTNEYYNTERVRQTPPVTEDIASTLKAKDNQKQNLSELVEDTQRLIKQMKEEINFDIASYAEEDGYSDDWTDDYDDEEEFDEEELGEEEYDEEDYDSEDYSESDDEYEHIELHTDVVDGANQTSQDHVLEAEGTSETAELQIQESEEEANVNTTTESNPIESVEVNPVEAPTNQPETVQHINIAFPEIPAPLTEESDAPSPASDSKVPIAEIEDNSLPEQVEQLTEHVEEIQTSSNSISAEVFPSPKPSVQTTDSDEILNTSAIGQRQDSQDSTSYHSSQTSIQNEAESESQIDASSDPSPNAGDNAASVSVASPSKEPIQGKITPSQTAKQQESDDETTESDSSYDSSDSKEASQPSQRSPVKNARLAAASTASKITKTVTPKSASKKETSVSLVKNLQVNSTVSKAVTDKKKITKISTATAAGEPSTSKAPGDPKPQTSTSKASVKSNTGAVSKIPKPTNEKSRSKSFSGPPPIISSVKKIQLELFNKQQEAAKTIKPSKITPPRVIRKNSITDTITKLMTPKQSPLDYLKKGAGSSSSASPSPSPSTSAFAKVESKIPKIPKIPKKKYHETCFSDENPSSSSEDESAIMQERLRRKQSEPVFRTYPSLLADAQPEPADIMAKKFVEAGLCDNYIEAELAAALVELKFQQDAAIWAAKECSDLEQAISMLQQECELCTGLYPMNEIVSMLKCTHTCCKDCAKNYFTIQITDRSINDCNCPYCKVPELHDPDANEDEVLEYFSNLDIFLKSILDQEVHELFQRKLRDRSLMQDPNFKWCVQCSSGFFARPKQKRLICPDCGAITCGQCRKLWEKQHEGLSCEKYQEWLDSNDPDKNIQGVLKHLATNGIDCPKCKFKFSLARGGCMHFTCSQCKFEFCYGCGKPFMMGAKCTISTYCSRLGLHSHHPRNCLFYLRDKEPKQLQDLLKLSEIPYDEEPKTDEKTDSNAKTITKCPVPLQKETPSGLIDTICNGDVPLKHAGLCRQHYVEYLVSEVSKANIDPLPILDLTDCVQELRRRGIPLPERGPWDTDEIYRGMCSKIVEAQIPLN